MEEAERIDDQREGQSLPGGARSATETVAGEEAPSSPPGPDGSRLSPSRPSPRAPPPPRSLEEAGLSEGFVAGLVLKALHVRGAAGGFDLSDMLALPMPLLDDVLRRLQERRLVEIHETRGPRRGEYVFKLTGAGRKRAAEELEVCRYVGPAPVPYEDFRRWVERQTIERTRISERELQAVLEGVVLPESMLDLLGPAINSGRSLFLYGESGNGKTLLAERIARVFGERNYVPHSVLVDGNVMIVYDPVHHGIGCRDDETETTGRRAAGEAPEPGTREGNGSATPPADEVASDPAAVESGVDVESGAEAVAAPGADGDPAQGPAPPAARAPGPVVREIVRSIPEHDRRYVEARRPVVVTGGELTLEQLDLRWDSAGRMYQAPPQLKAAGGVLVVDDLGRQRVPVRDLLNRWVVPLEHRRDYLTLRSGRKIVVPFDCFVIFSTNLEPRSLADEAFLRRIYYKIEVPDPGREEYERIFRSCCEERGIAFDEDALDFLFDEFYGTGAIQPRGCHPRDVLDHLQDLAEYLEEPARLSPRLLERACESYFVASG